MSVQGQDGTLAIEGALAPQVKYRTAMLAHADARAPSWATRADGARDGAHAREIER